MIFLLHIKEEFLPLSANEREAHHKMKAGSPGVALLGRTAPSKSLPELSGKKRRGRMKK